MGKDILISVCMPIYNEVATVERAIQSVLNQSYRNFELLIVDNVSDDGTYEKIQKFEDTRIKRIQNHANLGWRLNSNKALAMASGKYVVTLHGDDYFNNKLYFAKIVQLFERYPRVGVIHLVTLKGYEMILKSKNMIFKRLMKCSDYYSFVASLRYMPPPSVTVYRNEAIRGSGYYAKNYWTGEARLSMYIATRGYDALFEVNHDVERPGGATRDSGLPIHMKQRENQKYDFYLEFRKDPHIQKQDLAFLQKSLKLS